MKNLFMIEEQNKQMNYVKKLKWETETDSGN